MKKMLVLDIDGTLLNSNHKISKKTHDAIVNLIENDTYVTLASGRPSVGMFELLRTLNIHKKNNYFLSYNGGNITSALSNEILFSDALLPETVQLFAEIANTSGSSLICYDSHNIYTQKANDQSTLEASLNGCKIIETTIEKLKLLNTPKMIIADTEEKVKKMYDELLPLYSNDFNLAISMPIFLEITSKNVDKARSLERLCTHLDIAIKDVVACGDGGNDLSMIKFAGVGVAMDNAPLYIKDEADYITSSNDEDGIVQVIEQFFKR